MLESQTLHKNICLSIFNLLCVLDLIAQKRYPTYITSQAVMKSVNKIIPLYNMAVVLS